MFELLFDFIIEPLGAFTRLVFYKLTGKEISYREIINKDSGSFKLRSYYNLILGVIMFILIMYCVLKLYAMIKYD